MKKLGYIILSAGFLSLLAMNASAQGQSRSVSDFNGIAASGPFNVHVKIDGNESVRVDADSNIIDDIETVVENNTLKIRFKNKEYRHRDVHKAEVYVEAKSLSSLINSGSGGIQVDGSISGESCKVILSGSGNVNTQVKSGNLNAVISGSGSIKLSGSTSEAKFVVTGSGEIEGKSLKATSVLATITGSGNIYIEAEKSITGRITGSGSVIYSGSASNIDSRTVGSGRVTRDN